MAGLEIKCPFCGGSAGIRTSERPSLLTVQAQIYCARCGQLKADFVGQLTNIKRAVFIDCPEANSWEKTENELLKENKLAPMSNEERIKQLKAENTQLSFLPREKTPAERIEARANLNRLNRFSQ
ncbi:transcriptional regulator [Actinobacillus equuli subsp. haemolyticus]|uniref:transcriptional regulator n=1 Tax=Actinobacillus equuli TaxID=718 RepID=UPI0024467268|nr:transcriptional regulator [Actinobacillus equuli]WGE51330.1 transcriptional regulator [Actinobacillus equuli subsp. haemolyticus]